MSDLVVLQTRERKAQPDQKICQCGGQLFLIYGDGLISCVACSDEYGIEGWLDEAAT